MQVKDLCNGNRPRPLAADGRVDDDLSHQVVRLACRSRWAQVRPPSSFEGLNSVPPTARRHEDNRRFQTIYCRSQLHTSAAGLHVIHRELSFPSSGRSCTQRQLPQQWLTTGAPHCVEHGNYTAAAATNCGGGNAEPRRPIPSDGDGSSHRRLTAELDWTELLKRTELPQTSR